MKPLKAREDLALRAHEVREKRARELINENHDIASATKHRRDRHAHDISVNHVEREPSGARVRHAVRAVTGVDMQAGRLGRSAVPTRTRAFARGGPALARIRVSATSPRCTDVAL